MITIYFYCTKAKPYLEENSEPQFADKYSIFDKPRQNYADAVMNGKIVARCTADKAVKIPSSLLLFGKHDPEELVLFNTGTGLERRNHSCVSWEDVYSYSKGKDIYAIHLNDVSPCDFHLWEFSYDREGIKRIYRAPQSYCHAYHDGEERYIFSDRSKYCRYLLEKVKDVELRKSLPKEGIEICK